MQEMGRPGRIARWRIAVWGGAAALLLAPAIAMRFTPEVSWGPGDFVVFAAMLAAVCVALEALVRITQRRAYRVAGALAILATFLVVWAELAVGIW